MDRLPHFTCGPFPDALFNRFSVWQLLGWPFIALLFVPLAVHVLHQSIADKGLIKGASLPSHFCPPTCPSACLPAYLPICLPAHVPS